jgi:hypothetical protein
VVAQDRDPQRAQAGDHGSRWATSNSKPPNSCTRCFREGRRVLAHHQQPVALRRHAELAGVCV